MNARHFSNTDSWGTPSWLINKVKQVLGDIDLDPCSSNEYNKNVNAKRIINEQSDALIEDWGNVSTVFINPPGGIIKGKSKSALIWKRLMFYYDKKFFDHAIWIGFSVEQLQVIQNYGIRSPASFPICIFKSRIYFININGNECKNPTHSSYITYIPCKQDKTDLFKKVFYDLGQLTIGVNI